MVVSALLHVVVVVALAVPIHVRLHMTRGMLEMMTNKHDRWLSKILHLGYCVCIHVIFNAFDDCIEIVFDVNFALRKTLEFMIFFL